MSEQESVREGLHERRQPCGVTFEWSDKTFSGTSTHFDARGMLVMCKNPAPLNARGTITLSFPGLNNPVELNGEVVWTNIHGAGDSLSPRGMGVKFVGLDRDTERMLTDLSAKYESLASIYACYYT